MASIHRLGDGITLTSAVGRLARALYREYQLFLAAALDQRLTQ